MHYTYLQAGQPEVLRLLRILKLVRDLPDPREVVLYFDVNTRDAVLAAADPPGDDADQLPDATSFADHRAASVALASVFALFPSGADEAGVKFEVIAKPSLLKLSLALVVAKDRYIHLLKDVLVFAVVAESVFAPAGGPTPGAGEVRVLIRQAGRGDVRADSRRCGPFQPQDGQVVIKSTCVEFRVHVDIEDVSFLIREKFDVVVDIPFTQPNPQVKRRVRFDAVSSGEDVQRIDQSSTADVYRFLRVFLEDGHLPWVFTEFAIAVDVDWIFYPSVDAVRVSDTALS